MARRKEVTGAPSRAFYLYGSTPPTLVGGRWQWPASEAARPGPCIVLSIFGCWAGLGWAGLYVVGLKDVVVVVVGMNEVAS